MRQILTVVAVVVLACVALADAQGMHACQPKMCRKHAEATTATLPANPKPPCMGNDFVVIDQSLLDRGEERVWDYDTFVKRFLGPDHAGMLP